MANPWKTLNIPPTKDKDLINKAWRKLASKHHPDHGGDADTFKKIRLAYEDALSKCSTVVEVIRPNTTISVNVCLGCSEVLRPQYTTITFEHQGKTIDYSVLVPEWEMEWGRNKSLLIKSQPGITLVINVELVDDDIEWRKNQLIWSPILELMPVLQSGNISLVWEHKNINLNIDKHGHAVLLSQGYKTSTGERLDIIVQPKYIWPKIDPC